MDCSLLMRSAPQSPRLGKPQEGLGAPKATAPLFTYVSQRMDFDDAAVRGTVLSLIFLVFIFALGLDVIARSRRLER